MPELPEVETIRRDLLTRVVGQPIEEVLIRLPKTVKSHPEVFTQTLLGNAFTNIERVGKLLQFELARTDLTLLMHLKMTGQLLYQKGEDFAAGGHPFPAFSDPLPNKYTHLEFGLADGGRLYFNDLRQFGYAKLVEPQERSAIVAKFGLEPLTPDFTWEAVHRIFEHKRGVLKAVLLDQSVFSGLGNIYADEVCFLAKIRPTRRVESLTLEEQRRLYEACQVVLADAIRERGTSFRDYRDSDGKEGGYAKFLKVYGRAGEPCLICGTAIEKIRLAGRGTHFCPTCQL